ncbi:MAG TPA: ferritin-like domain-containing protein [Pseudonocardiaceae bacterium]
MTSPANPTSAGAPVLQGAAVDAVQQALAAEHAAEWCYDLVMAFLTTKALQENAARDALAHQARRDATERMLRDAGATPASAQPAYRAEVTDEPSAIALLVTVEADAAVAWRGVLERTEDPELRRRALAALVESATRGARWRKTAGSDPMTVPFPGQPA